MLKGMFLFLFKQIHAMYCEQYFSAEFSEVFGTMKIQFLTSERIVLKEINFRTVDTAFLDIK
jgi:hypothetical protein